MDITFRTVEGLFNYRVCAVIINKKRLLAMRDERSPYYYLPGGRVKLHETAEEAVIRELKEELKIEATIDRALWLNQNYFVEDVNKEKYHEICLYFLMDVSRTKLLTEGDTFEVREENKILVFEWLHFEELESRYFYPLFIKKEIFSLPKHLTLTSECK